MSTENNYTIPGITLMLQGVSGAGKTHSLSTLVEAGITPFIIFTEKGMSTLGKLNIPKEKCHWHHIQVATQDWAAMEGMSRSINKMSYEALTKVSDPNKQKYDQFLEVYKTCHNFKCDRTGEEFGDVSTWNTDRALVVDTLSGLSLMSMNLTIGAKPTKGMQDWMVAMDNLERLIIKFTTDLRCHFVLTTHLEREADEVTGAISLMASTLGKKLAPKLPQHFDEVLLALHEGDKWMWSTAARGAITKTRLLENSDNLPPSFVPLIKAWQKAGGKILPTVAS